MHAARAPDETWRRHVERRAWRGWKRDIRERPFYGRFDFGDVEGLADVVEGAGAHGVNRGLQRAKATDEHDMSARVALLEGAQDVHAVLLRVEVDIRDQ